MTGEDRVFDEGLQLERTALAWQRTLLALGVGSLALGRALQPIIGDVSWLAAALGVAVSITGFVLARRRYVAVHRHLTTDPVSLPGGGVLIAATALVVLGIGLAALAFGIHHAVS
ncbi:MAG: DUF202 domain-containing protein [Rhodoglobus sp.]